MKTIVLLFVLCFSFFYTANCTTRPNIYLKAKVDQSELIKNEKSHAKKENFILRLWKKTKEKADEEMGVLYFIGGAVLIIWGVTLDPEEVSKKSIYIEETLNTFKSMLVIGGVILLLIGIKILFT